MNYLSWTMIKANGPNFGPRLGLSLTAVTVDHLVLYGGSNFETTFHDTWIFDIGNGMWKEYTQFKDQARYSHTGARGLTKSVFIIGGFGPNTENKPTSHLLLEPKTLQQLAMQIIYQHKDMLPWKSLPSRIMNQLMDPVQDEEPDY